jgi:hypothetical protein
MQGIQRDPEAADGQFFTCALLDFFENIKSKSIFFEPEDRKKKYFFGSGEYFNGYPFI